MGKKRWTVALMIMTGLLAACQSGKPVESVTPEKESSSTAEETIRQMSVKDIEVLEGTELNVTTTFAGEESNVRLYQDKMHEWMDKTGCLINDSSASADETMKEIGRAHV